MENLPSTSITSINSGILKRGSGTKRLSDENDSRGTKRPSVLQDVTNRDVRKPAPTKLALNSLPTSPVVPVSVSNDTSALTNVISSSSLFQDKVGGENEESSELKTSGDDSDEEKLGKEDPTEKGGDDNYGHPHSQGILTWHDPLNQYTETIYAELRQNELKYKPRNDYMEGVQKDINHVMRGILVDWLVEVGEEYKLSSQTLFLTVRYIDRLLSAVSVHRTKLQLVGITCMLLASKYEEIYPPSVDDFVYISDNTYSREEVLRMETVLLNSLKFALTNSTCWEFSRRYSAACGLDKRTTSLVAYITEAFLQEPLYLKFLPSQVGAGAVYLALFTTRQKPWTKTLERASRYSLPDLKDVIAALHQTMLRLYQGHCTLKAVKNKYSEPKLYRVALIVPPTDLT